MYLDGDPPLLSNEKPSWKSKKPACIIGQSLKNFDDLIGCVHGWQNPEYEKLRYVYIKDSVIVDSEGVTCRRTAGKDALIEDTREGIKHMKEHIAALDADSVFMIHNHPSGDSTPVATDRDLAISLGKMVPELRAHIVINSGWFGLITLDGLAILCILPDSPSDSFYPLLTSFSHGMLYDSSTEIAAWARALTAKRKKPLIIWLSCELSVFDLQQLDLGEIDRWNQLASIKRHEIFDSGFGRAASVPPGSSYLDVLRKCRLLLEMGGFVHF
jgi:hypothetical protein